MEGVHGSGGATSPATSGRPGTAGDSYKRKRSGAEFESSPGSGGEGEGDEEEEGKRRQPGVKRACNECRQQKVSLPSVAVEGSGDIAAILQDYYSNVRR